MIRQKFGIALYAAGGILFLLQSFGFINFIPAEKAAGIFGLPVSPISIFYSMFVVFALTVFASYVMDRLFFGRVGSEDPVRRKQHFSNFFTAFLAVWLTFFAYAVFAIANVFPREIDNAQFLNFYLFWFFLLKTVEQYRLSRTQAVSVSTAE